ncbi:imelysin family protein [uncultured Barnesiella sp.]|uniref:imelysin family protein n=1 Tax=uncultured Barnesiella sp. TaxID=584861 RepID=UPI002603AD0D|nr:imelysin family protein [uncultured Barnesiella sp.]
MKRIFKKSSYSLALSVLLLGGVSCSESENDFSWEEQRETALQSAATAFVEKTVIPTYTSLADACLELADLCSQIETSAQANASTDIAASGSLSTATKTIVEQACAKWYEARKQWELSEAFLYGAAGDYNIDPHIDSWPLNATDLQALLDDPVRMGMMDAEYAAGLGYGLLGFHAIEYMLFDHQIDASSTTGKARSGAFSRKEELVYLTAVAGDLANQCVRLEASWKGLANVSSQKQTLLTEAELEPTFNYGESMKNAGKGGSKYKSYLEAAQEIIQGCSDIADEVGNQKIGRPNEAAAGASEDLSYIESPYAKNSKVDFYDNIVSIKNAYLGMNVGDPSVSNYLASINPTADTAVRNAIEAALNAIDAAPAPFVNYAGSHNELWKKATTACNDLKKALDEAQSAIGQ